MLKLKGFYFDCVTLKYAWQKNRHPKNLTTKTALRYRTSFKVQIDSQITFTLDIYN